MLPALVQTYYTLMVALAWVQAMAGRHAGAAVEQVYAAMARRWDPCRLAAAAPQWRLPMGCQSTCACAPCPLSSPPRYITQEETN